MHEVVKKLNNVASRDAAGIEVPVKSYMPNYTKPTYDTAWRVASCPCGGGIGDKRKA